MSFLDSVINMAGKAAESAQKKKEEINKYRSQITRLSDRQILNGCKMYSGTKKIAYMLEAKERGLLEQ